MRLKRNWKMTLFVLIMFPVLNRLGFWQLDRATEKYHLQEISVSRQNRDAQEIESLLEMPAAELAYRKVLLRGHYINDKNILIDNQIYRSIFGYDVVTPFQLSSGGLTVLVSRGWTKGNLDRTQYPIVAPVDGDLELIARVFVPTRVPYLIGSEEQNQGWPKRLAFVNFADFQSEFKNRLFPFVLRLEEEMPGVLARHWLSVGGLKPENHEGYAFQWFALAGTLMLCYLALIFDFIGFKARK